MPQRLSLRQEPRWCQRRKNRTFRDYHRTTATRFRIRTRAHGTRYRTAQVRCFAGSTGHSIWVGSCGLASKKYAVHGIAIQTRRGSMPCVDLPWLLDWLHFGRVVMRPNSFLPPGTNNWQILTLSLDAFHLIQGFPVCDSPALAPPTEVH